MNRAQLLNALEESHEYFLESLEDLQDDQLNQAGAAGDWSIKDIMAHLMMWESETITLLYQARQGQKPTTVHFKNISDDEQNAIWHETAKDRPLELIWQDFTNIRKQTIRRVAEFNEKELTDTNQFSWLKGNSLLNLVVDYIIDHENAHAEQINLWREQNQI